MFKRLSSLVLAILMVLGMVPFTGLTSYAAKNEEANYFFPTLDTERIYLYIEREDMKNGAILDAVAAKILTEREFIDKEIAWAIQNAGINSVDVLVEDKVVKVVGSKNLNNHPVCLSSEGEVSIEMEKVLSMQMGAENMVKAQKVLEINLNHPIVSKLSTASEEEFNNLCEILYFQASLIAGLEVKNASSITEKIINMLLNDLR